MAMKYESGKCWSMWTKSNIGTIDMIGTYMYIVKSNDKRQNQKKKKVRKEEKKKETTIDNSVGVWTI